MTELPTLSLFDRLIDDAPDTSVERVSDDELQRQLKHGMRRDLEGLLNGKRPHARWLPHGSALEQTVLGFGLPDLSTDDFSSAVARERIRRLIATTIRLHEPRLRRLEVETDGGPTSTGVRFRISAVMLVEATEEPVIYDASLRPTDREFAVRLSR